VDLKGYSSKIRSIDPADTDFSDRPVWSAVKDARIVLLGEQTHGEGSTFRPDQDNKIPARKMGFEVLAFEAGFMTAPVMGKRGRRRQYLTGSCRQPVLYVCDECPDAGPVQLYSVAVAWRPPWSWRASRVNIPALRRNTIVQDFEKFVAASVPGSPR